MIPLKDDNPTRTLPFVNYGLIFINLLVFMWEINSGAFNHATITQMAIVPARVMQGGLSVENLRSAFVSMFMHASWAHLLGNMLYLWIFGDNVEDALGHFRYIFFYLMGGFAATSTHVLLYPASTVPTVGASGAIAAVLGAYLLLYPHRRVVTLIPLGFFVQLARVPAVIVLGFWFLLQLIEGALALGAAELAGVAFWAHIGGFVFGLILGPLLRKRGQPETYRDDWNRW